MPGTTALDDFLCKSCAEQGYGSMSARSASLALERRVRSVCKDLFVTKCQAGRPLRWCTVLSSMTKLLADVESATAASGSRDVVNDGWQ